MPPGFTEIFKASKSEPPRVYSPKEATHCFIRCISKCQGINDEEDHLLDLYSEDKYVNVNRALEIANECLIRINIWIREGPENKFSKIAETGNIDLPINHLIFESNHCYLVNPLRKAGREYTFMHFIKCKCGKHIKIGSKHFTSCNKCPTCGRYNTDIDSHMATCKATEAISGKKALYKNKKENKYIQKAKKQDKKVTKQVWFADFEAFTSPEGEHVVYAASICNIEDTVNKVFYGPKALADFIGYISAKTNKVLGTLYFFNGSKYDIHLLLEGLVSAGSSLLARDEILKKGNAYMSITLKAKGHGTLDLNDLRLFTLGSLAGTAKAFGVEEKYWKTEFDFKKINSWKDVYTHRNEVEAYVLQDSVCLREVFKKFNSTIHSLFNLNITSCISLSHLADKIWTVIIPEDMKIWKPDLAQDRDMRKGYYGGRVAPQHPTFKSQAKEKASVIKGSKELYNEILKSEDYLVYADVVSLYPSVMFDKEFPISEPTHTKEDMLFMELVEDGELSTQLCYLKVDYTCPKNLVTPYLYRRDENGNPVNNLEDGVAQWFYGPDIKEALKLGYSFTKVHEGYIWEEGTNDVFREYIDVCFKGKNMDSKEKGIKYQIYKILMNALSGKHAQKVIHTKYTILLATDKEFKQGCPANADNITPLLNSSSELIGYTYDIPLVDAAPSHATYLSGFILAYSRQRMSGFLRKAELHTDPFNAIFYQDTDSYIMKKQTWDLIHSRSKGKELGKLMDEYPGMLITHYSCISKKTYAVELLTPDGDFLIKIRCKGIPHTGDLINPAKAPIKFTGTAHNPQMVDLKKVYYTLGDGTMVNYLHPRFYDDVIENGERITAHYGSLIRKTGKGTSGGTFGIVPLISSRVLSKECYWVKGERVKIGDHWLPRLYEEE